MSASSHSLVGEPVKVNEMLEVPRPLGGPDRVESSRSYLVSGLSSTCEKPVWLSFGKCWHLSLFRAIIISQGILSIQNHCDQQWPSVRDQSGEVQKIKKEWKEAVVAVIVFPKNGYETKSIFKFTFMQVTKILWYAIKHTGSIIFLSYQYIILTQSPFSLIQRMLASNI